MERVTGLIDVTDDNISFFYMHMFHGHSSNSYTTVLKLFKKNRHFNFKLKPL